MQLDIYSCRVRHNGNPLHEIPLTGITSRELVLLKDIQGADSIVGVTKTGSVDVEQRLELFRLVEKYGSREDSEATARIKKRVERLFNVTLDDLDDWLAGRLEQADGERESRREQHNAEVASINTEARKRVEAEMREQIRQEERAKARAEMQRTSDQPAVAEARVPVAG